jgi:hypothetical protein
MCENSVNVGQLKLAVGQIDDTIALAQQHAEQLHQLADRGKQPDAAKALAQVTVMLGESRSRLEEAIDALDGRPAGADVTVELL